MKFVQIKRTKCQQCRRFVSCAITDKTPICSKCNPAGFSAAAEAQKEAWLKGEF
jgi:hypothetical protein